MARRKVEVQHTPKPSILEEPHDAGLTALPGLTALLGEVRPGLRVQGGGEIVGFCGGERIAWAIIRSGRGLRQVPLAKVALEGEENEA